MAWAVNVTPDDETITAAPEVRCEGTIVQRRQRDLAGRRRGHFVGRLPAGLCGSAVRLLPAGCLHVAGPDPARRRVRVPLQDTAPAANLGFEL
jgi:hypothetical protein